MIYANLRSYKNLYKISSCTILKGDVSY